jgi:hypothetical protein
MSKQQLGLISFHVFAILSFPNLISYLHVVFWQVTPFSLEHWGFFFCFNWRRVTWGVHWDLPPVCHWNIAQDGICTILLYKPFGISQKETSLVRTGGYCLEVEHFLYLVVTYWFHTYVHMLNDSILSLFFHVLISVHVFSYKEIEMSWLDLGVGVGMTTAPREEFTGGSLPNLHNS